MIGLNGSLSIAARALAAQYAGLAAANNNIANVNTAGYSRQVVNLSSVASMQGGTSVSAGVSFDGYTSVRDAVLQHAITAKNSDAGSLTAQNTALSKLNSAFASGNSGVGDAISGLFSKLSALSLNPTDASARQAVVGAAGTLVSSFHQEAGALRDGSTEADQQVVTTVAQVNQLTSQIAALDAQLSSGSSSGSDGGALQDQRDELTKQLSGLVGVSVTQTDGQPSLATLSGTPLVIGGKAIPLQIGPGADGKARVLDATGTDITSGITGGQLGGALTVRDTTLPRLSAQLDGLAAQLGAALNAAQGTGTDATGTAGGPMFSFVTLGSGAAASMKSLLTSGSQLALSNDGSAAGTGNLQKLLSVQTTALSSGQTPTDTYSSFVANVGAAGAQVDADLKGTTAVLSQLTAQRDSTSGVSIDEESTNLIRFQQAYTAAAKVISTINQMYSVVMNLTGGS